MRLKVFSIAILCLLAWQSHAQYAIWGKVTIKGSTTPVQGCVIRLNKTKFKTESDQQGNYRISQLTPGTYKLQSEINAFKTITRTVNITDSDVEVSLELDTMQSRLLEVLIRQKHSELGIARMNAVEAMGIYEGKKTEVIQVDKLVANVATNNARQVFSRIAGLNIWENDGAGLQLSVGGRGLDPNRSANFNVRQNGYDISADALGYPESYYSPPIEAVGKIQIVRGAASLQYGTQFGGLINFVMKKPIADKKMEIQFRQTVGSFGFYNAFTSLSGTIKKFSYYTFFQYKKLDGWRPNSQLNSIAFYTDLHYQFTKKTSLSLDYTYMGYLAQQPGGLTDQQFNSTPLQSNRERNWFEVNWKLLALHFDHKWNALNEFNLRLFGLSAYRNAIGFRPNRVATIDNQSNRDLLKGDFENIGGEARYLKRYFIKEQPMVLLVGARYYHGYNHSIQGLGSNGKDANFSFIDKQNGILNDYTFPNENVALFVENIIHVTDKFSITPGIRLEYIHTRANGFYGTFMYDLAGNLIASTRTKEQRNNERKLLLTGIGMSLKPFKHIELYGNISQNYRSITFNDMRITNPSQVIDPNLKDERGYSIDMGLRSYETNLFHYDISAFILNYNNRIGEVQYYDVSNRILRLRTNIGQAVMSGIESYIESDLWQMWQANKTDVNGILFANIAWIHSEYVKSGIPGIAGKQVEYVPEMNLKTGIKMRYKRFKCAYQFSYISQQFSDATNAVDGGVSSVVGLVPAYKVMDLSASYTYKKVSLEASCNNLTNAYYFTRRATGYPGPGILPSDGRAFFITLAIKI